MKLIKKYLLSVELSVKPTIYILLYIVVMILLIKLITELNISESKFFNNNTKKEIGNDNKEISMINKDDDFTK
ncbi:MAG: hypothetical protein H8D45_12155 [Bacteroidetes bacterium]|nr:hypothetical protein [Bacteroidota bacterium]